jgi:hypothetical protein
MEIFALPGLLPDSILELFEAPLQGFLFSTPSACGPLLPGEFVQVFTNEAGQGRVAVHGDLPDPSHQVFWQRKRDIHAPILRETLITCNSPCFPPGILILRFLFVLSVSLVLKLIIYTLHAETPRANVSEQKANYWKGFSCPNR